MNKLEIRYTRRDQSNVFANFAEALQSPERDGVITLSPAMGKGFIQRVRLGQGLSAMVWDFTLNTSLQLIRSEADDPTSAYFHLHFVLTPSAIAMEGIPVSSNAMNVVMDAGSNYLNVTVAAGVPVRALIFTMTRTWIIEEFAQGGVDYSEFLSHILRPHVPLMSEPVSSADLRLVTDLHEQFTRMLRLPLALKSKSLSLLSEFFSVQYSRFHQGATITSLQYREEMKIVDEIIMQHIDSQLPSLQEIAQRVAMSESSLKRHFRQAFDCSVYDYYLQKKMQRARELLIDQHLPVKEVAYGLGYEKASSLIRTFKKFYSLPPGDYVKKAV